MAEKRLVEAVFRQLRRDQAGFSLIELLVVMLILGILAAVALPAFFGQKAKAIDAQAKETAHAAQVAMETCMTDSSGSYAKCNVAALQKLDKALPAGPKLAVSGLGAETYTIVVQSTPTTHTFSIKRAAKGVMTFPCVKKSEGGCPAKGDWGS